MSPDSGTAADRGPLLGALLRLAHQSILRKILNELSDAGVDDVQSAHFAPMQVLWDHPEGVRLTQLSTKAKITKQSMGELVDQLARRGYVKRVSDPGDGRAWLIRVTPKGRDVSRLIRKIVRGAEAEWSCQIGAERIEELRKTLRMLLENESR